MSTLNEPASHVNPAAFGTVDYMLTHAPEQLERSRRAWADYEHLRRVHRRESAAKRHEGAAHREVVALKRVVQMMRARLDRLEHP